MEIDKELIDKLLADYVSHPTTLGMMFTEKPPRHRAAFVRCYPPLQSPWAPFPFTR
jgi:hypothetical protein